MGEIIRSRKIPKHIALVWLVNTKYSNVPRLHSVIRAPCTTQSIARNNSNNRFSTIKSITKMQDTIKSKMSIRIIYENYLHQHTSKLQQKGSDRYRRHRFQKFAKRRLRSMNRTNSMKANIPTIIEILSVKVNDTTKTRDNVVSFDYLLNTQLLRSQYLIKLMDKKLNSSLVPINDIFKDDIFMDKMYNAKKFDEKISDNIDVSNEKMVTRKEKGIEATHEVLNTDRIINELCNNRNFRIRPQTFVVNLLDLGREAPPPSIQGMDWSCFKDEKFRIRTFLNYPTRAAKSALVLAENGFVYTGSGRNNDDTVICHFCIVRVRDWQSSDVVPDVHKMRSPNCSMVTRINCENIPLASNEDFNHILSLLNPQSDNFVFVDTIKNSNIETDCASDNRRPDVHQLSTDIETDCASGLRHLNVPLQFSDIEADCAYESKRQDLHRANTSHPFNVGSTARQTNEKLPNHTAATPRFASIPESPVISQQPSTPTRAVQVSHGPSQANHGSSSTNQPRSPTVASHTARNSTPSGTQTLTPSTNNVATTSSATTAAATTTSATTAAATTTSATTAAATTVTPSTSQTNSTAGTTTTQSTGGQKDNKNGKGPTYAELGIMTERPKRPEYALRAKRLETFTNWPRHHHLKPEDLSGAGFYYAGYGDCARCFFCGGGLRNWEDEDDVWVEHARWFPKCAYIRQLMGPVFVEKVQELNKTRDQIPYSLVIESMGNAGSAFKPDTKENPLKKDPAVKTVLELGFYQEKDVFEIAESLKNGASFLSADVILQRLQDKKEKSTSNTKATTNISVPNPITTAKDEEAIREIKERNNQLRQQTVCKICMDKEVAVVFLPCGHLVSCSECGAAMKDCPVCRVNIKGVVRAFMS